MSKTSEKKNAVKGSIASLQTVLERYPVLLTTNDDATETSFGFMLNLLRLFGVEEKQILDWLSGILADGPDGTSGVLTAIEIAIKAVILATFKETYTCSINPTLPDDVMMSFDDSAGGYVVRGNGIEIPLNDIDAFGLFKNVPTNEETSVFYFDTDPEKDYTPQNVYSSMDFNAYLWYVINKGNFWADSQKKKCVWDNRGIYYKLFAKTDCLDGKSVNDDNTPKGKFFNTSTLNAATLVVPDVGPKSEILACEYRENGSIGGSDPRTIRVYLNSNRYFRNISHGLSNRTIFEFNADYISSMKLFDAKTLVAQIINAVMGIGSSIPINISVEQNVLSKKLEGITRSVIIADDNEDDLNADCFSFSNEDYNSMLEDAELQYEGLFESGNENGDLVNVDSNAILSDIYQIGAAEDIEERKTAISSAFQNAASTISKDSVTKLKDQFAVQTDIVSRFIQESIVQICMQVLSPKILLLYAINEKIMYPDKKRTDNHSVIDFIKDFKNIIVSLIRQINKIILQQLFDFLIGQIKPLITLFVQKLLLETLYDYKLLINALIQNCTLGTRFTNNEFSVDTVLHADIIPEATPTDEGEQEL